MRRLASRSFRWERDVARRESAEDQAPIGETRTKRTARSRARLFVCGPSILAYVSPPSVLDFFREAKWLTPERARGWCRVLAAVTAIGVVVWVAFSRDGVDHDGKPLGTDFASFWIAARLAREGHVSAVYDPSLYAAVQERLFPTMSGRYMYPYPPPFLLLCLPLAFLAYLPALVAWLGATFVPFFTCVRRILPERWAILPVFAFPAVFANLGHGHNGFLTAACLGGAMILAEERPYLAGLCLGFLIFKPHLALVAPFALLAARRWRVIAGAATSAITFCALSLAVLGGDAWRGFRQMTRLSRSIVEQGLAEYWKMQSVFSAVRLVHGGIRLAYAVQIVVAIGVLALVVKTALRRPGAEAEGALVVAATPLCIPYIMDYDLVLLALPLAWTLARARASAWEPWEKIVLFAAYVLPLVARPLAMAAALPLAPVVLGALFAIVLRRVRREETTPVT